MERLLAFMQEHRRAAIGGVLLIIAAGMLLYYAPWQEEGADELPLPVYQQTGQEDADSPVAATSATATTAATPERAASSPELNKTGNPAQVTQIIVVDVKGAVLHPGIYTLPEGSRVFQAVEAAGSFLENADNRLLNMAERLVDGAVVYVPFSVGAVDNPAVDRKSSGTGSDADAGEAAARLTVGLLSNQLQPGVNAPAPASGEGQGSAAANGKININTASAEELQQLKGIGPAKAEEIIRYRETNGPFKSIEELSAIKGIGTKTIEKLGNYITVK